MPDDLRVNGWLLIPDSELRERFSRSSGPGGQSVNTADSRVELSFDVEHSPALPEWARVRALERLAGRLAGGVLTVAASEQRSQLANRQAARARLTALLRAQRFQRNFAALLINDRATRLRAAKRLSSGAGTRGRTGIDLIVRHRHQMGNAQARRKLRGAKDSDSIFKQRIWG